MGFCCCGGAGGGGTGFGTGGAGAGLTILAQDDLGSIVRDDDLAVGVDETGTGGGLGEIAAAVVPLTGDGCSST